MVLIFSVLQVIQDEMRQRDVLLEDEEEDFLDEATVNPHSRGCPPARKCATSTRCAPRCAPRRRLRRLFLLLQRDWRHKRPRGWRRSSGARRLDRIRRGR